MYTGSKIDFIGKQFQLIPIRSCTKNANIANFVLYGENSVTLMDFI